MIAAEAFAPHAALAQDLIPHAADTGDGSHDLAHIHRVFRNAMRIHAGEGGDGNVLAASVLLHDCVAVEKNSPLRAQASRLAAEKASGILAGLGWQKQDIDAAAHAITTHSFSANIEPQTLEAKSFRMPTGWMPSAWWGGPLLLYCRAHGLGALRSGRSAGEGATA